MMNKVRIKIPYDDTYSIVFLRRKNIDIYNIEYMSTGTIYTITEADLDKLDLDTIEVVSHKGIKNILLKIKRSKHFLICIFISILMVILSSFIIVDVKVIHSDKDIRSLILDELYGLGIKPFIPKKSFKEIQEIKKKIKETYPNDIEWLEIIDEGMRYTVRVEERIITDIKEEPKYCNVISKRDATILNSVSSKGQMIVGQNDFVKKGDTIISGQIKFNEETKTFVCAEGEVYGNTWYKVAVSIPLNHIKKDYTGNSQTNFALEMGSQYERIFKIHYDAYDTKKKRIFKLGQFSLYKETNREYKPIKKKYTEEEALESARTLGREKLQVQLDDNAVILSEKVLQSNNYDSIISVEIFYSVKEIISERIESEIPEFEGVGEDVQSTE